MNATEPRYCPISTLHRSFARELGARDYESHAAALDRNELGALLVAAGLGPPAEHALISLLALNGLRVSEATGADIEHLDLERGHRTLTITRKGGEVVTICSRRALPGRSTWPSASAPTHQCSWPRTARRLDRRATYIVAAHVAGAAR